MPGSDQNKTDKMRHRLDEVKSRIDKLSPHDEKTLQNAAPVSTKRRSTARALRLGTDLIAGVAVGGLIGFWLDRLFETRPVLFILFLLLGIAAGLLNVIRTARQIQSEQAELVEQGQLDMGQDQIDDDDDDDD